MSVTRKFHDHIDNYIYNDGNIDYDYLRDLLNKGAKIRISYMPFGLLSKAYLYKKGELISFLLDNGEKIKHNDIRFIIKGNRELLYDGLTRMSDKKLSKALISICSCILDVELDVIQIFLQYGVELLFNLRDQNNQMVRYYLVTHLAGILDDSNDNIAKGLCIREKYDMVNTHINRIKLYVWCKEVYHRQNESYSHICNLPWCLQKDILYRMMIDVYKCK